MPPRLLKVLWGYLSNLSTQSWFKHPNTMATWNPGHSPDGRAWLWTSAQSHLCTNPWATSLIHWPLNPIRGWTEHFPPEIELMKIHNIKIKHMPLETDLINITKTTYLYQRTTHYQLQRHCFHSKHQTDIYFIFITFVHRLISILSMFAYLHITIRIEWMKKKKIEKHLKSFDIPFR